MLTKFLTLDSFNITDDIESEADPLLLELHSEVRKKVKRKKVTDDCKTKMQNKDICNYLHSGIISFSCVDTKAVSDSK